MNLFTYKVSGLKGSVVYTDFVEAIEIQIKSDKISKATEELKNYFAQQFLTADKILLVKIEILDKK